MKISIDVTTSSDGVIIGGWLTVDGVMSELTDEILDQSMVDLIDSITSDEDEPEVSPAILTAEKAAEIDQWLFEDEETGELVGIVAEAIPVTSEDEDGDE
jgi:hypothetical protein